MTIRNFGAVQKLKAQPQGLQLGLGTGGSSVVGDVLVGKTFTNDNGEQTGTMPNNGAFNLGLGVTVPAGYYSGGTTANGKMFASGTLTPSSLTNMTTGTVTGLPFIPKLIIFKNTNGADYYDTIALKIGSTWIPKMVHGSQNISNSYGLEVSVEPVDGSFTWKVTGGLTMNNVTWFAFESTGF